MIDGAMEIGEIIAFLTPLNPDHRCPIGWSGTCSYRGYYSELCVEPAKDVTIGEMLSDVVAAVGETFEGYKGGDFMMDEGTSVFYAHYSECGEPVTRLALKLMTEAAGDPRIMREYTVERTVTRVETHDEIINTYDPQEALDQAKAIWANVDSKHIEEGNRVSYEVQGHKL